MFRRNHALHGAYCSKAFPNEGVYQELSIGNNYSPSIVLLKSAFGKKAPWWGRLLVKRFVRERFPIENCLF
jgi:hypothetical protein